MLYSLTWAESSLCPDKEIKFNEEAGTSPSHTAEMVLRLFFYFLSCTLAVLSMGRIYTIPDPGERKQPLSGTR